MSDVSLLEQHVRAGGQTDPWASVQLIRTVLLTPNASASLLQQSLVLARAVGDEWGAIELGRRLLAATGGSPHAAYLLAEALTDAGRAAEAVTLLEPKVDQLDQNLIFKFSRMLMLAGRRQEAHARARSLLSTNAASPQLWERLAQTKTFSSPSDPDITEMRRLFALYKLSNAANLRAISAALAKAMIDIGDDAEANRFLVTCGEAFQALYRYDPRVLDTATTDIEAWCELAAGDDVAVDEPSLHRPIFILGPNRSGTTLVDQILSMHSDVVAGGERRHFWIVTRPLGDCSAKSIDTYIERRGQAGWVEIGARYRALAEESAGRRASFTDKLLSNVYRVRAIRNSLSAARIIYVRRNPLDVAWSCWRGQFDQDAPWSGSPAGVAQYVMCYRRSMEAWSRRFPDLIHIVDYEALVRSPEPVISELLAFCGLPDDPATRAPHLSSRASPTLSFDAVRDPINPQREGAAKKFPISARSLRDALERRGWQE